MNNVGDENVENKKTEKIDLGFCSKFQPQLAPRAVGAGKTLIDYRIHYFPCMGDKCADSWCHTDQMCRHRCEHELGYHIEEGEAGEINNENLDNVNKL